MLQPSEIVGREFLVTVISDLGQWARRMIAFDADDARSQILEYCRAEGLIALEIAVK